jgi:hypothetical protein
MEQVRAILEVLKKYHFWILCGLIVILCFVSWFLATSDEAQRYQARKTAIDGQFSLVGKISSNSQHPSEKYNQQISDLESGTLTSEVSNASTHLYRDMRENNPLPMVFTDKTAQDGFKEAFEKIWRPMEEIEKLPPSQQLEELYRNRYRDHIDKHFPELFKLIDRRREAEIPDNPAASAPQYSGGMRGRRGPPNRDGRPGRVAVDQTKKMVGTVDWIDADEKIQTFLTRYAGAATPTTLDIAMAQEELWVYETLLKVIRNTNDVGPDPRHSDKEYKKPDSHNTARIKQILSMDIGRDAVEKWKKCESALFTVPGEGSTDAGAAGALPTGPSGPRAAREAAGQSGPGPMPGVSPLADRYVDDKGKPLTDPTQQPYGEFRMMPINLKLVIEQKDIPRLLAECANSAMRIDVRGVRILAEEPPPADLSTADSAASGTTTGETTPPPPPTPTPRSRSRYMDPRRGGPAMEPAGAKGDSDFSEDSADPVYPSVPVEVQGIIYIYNPPHIKAPDETAGGNGGQAASPTTSGGAPAGVAPTAPSAPGTVTNPPSTTPASGGRP